MDPQEVEAINYERHVRIICIGAGASGLCFAYKLHRSFYNFSLTVGLIPNVYFEMLRRDRSTRKTRVSPAHGMKIHILGILLEPGSPSVCEC